MTSFNKKHLSRILYIISGLILGGVTLYLSFREVEWDTLFGVFEYTQWFWLTLAILSSLIVASLKAGRWHRLLLPHLHGVSWLLTFSLLILSQTLNLLVPVRGAGETLRVGLLAKKTRSNALQIGGTLILEKLLDLLSLVLLAFVISPLIIELFEPTIVKRLIIMLGIVGLGLFVVLWFRGKVLDRQEHRTVLSYLLSNLMDGFEALKTQKLAWEILGWTAAIRICSVFSIFLALRGARVDVSLYGITALHVFLNFSYLLPTPPGMIGLVQYVSILVLGLLGVVRTQALGAGLLLHVVIIAPMLLLVLPSWLYIFVDRDARSHRYLRDGTI